MMYKSLKLFFFPTLVLFFVIVSEKSNSVAKDTKDSSLLTRSETILLTAPEVAGDAVNVPEVAGDAVNDINTATFTCSNRRKNRKREKHSRLARKKHEKRRIKLPDWKFSPEFALAGKSANENTGDSRDQADDFKALPQSKKIATLKGSPDTVITLDSPKQMDSFRTPSSATQSDSLVLSQYSLLTENDALFPFFDKNSPTVVAAQVGSSAYLTCKINNLDDKAVSWIRNRDSHILTVDKYTFISDSRFASHFDEDSGTWTLQIKFTKPQDAGQYECQLSTEPKKSHFVKLEVIVPKVTIPGAQELHVKAGSDVLFTCVISNVLKSPAYIFWFHDGRRIHDGDVVGGFVRSGPVLNKRENSSSADLYIVKVIKEHAGNYTCAPAAIESSAWAKLHVLVGEQQAAMQHDSNSAPEELLTGRIHTGFSVMCWFLVHQLMTSLQNV